MEQTEDFLLKKVFDRDFQGFCYVVKSPNKWIFLSALVAVYLNRTDQHSPLANHCIQQPTHSNAEGLLQTIFFRNTQGPTLAQSLL